MTLYRSNRTSRWSNSKTKVVQNSLKGMSWSAFIFANNKDS